MENETGQAMSFVHLRVTPEVQQARRLVLSYEVENTGAGRIYLFAPPLRFGPHAVVEVLEEGGWVFQEGDHAVRIVRAILRPSRRVAARLPIIVVPVEPGTTHTGRIVLPLPLVESHPYLPSAEENTGAQYSISQARLQFGWVEARNGVEPKPLLMPGGVPRLQLAGAWGMPLQRIVELVVPLSGVSLRRHPGPFDRPMPAQ